MLFMSEEGVGPQSLVAGVSSSTLMLVLSSLWLWSGQMVESLVWSSASPYNTNRLDLAKLYS